MKKLSNDELVSIIEAHRRQSLGDEASELSNERSDAMDHYHGRPYGDEQDGRSTVVSKDLSDTVGWMMPAVMKVFLSSGNIAEFEPNSEEDIESAQEASDYVNQVIMKDNDGFLVLHDWVKDTLILKNGYVKHWWDETEKVSEQDYADLDAMTLTQLIGELEQDGEVEILEQDVKASIDQNGMPVELYDIKVRITKTIGRVRIEAVPTEEIRVSKRAKAGTQTSQFIEWYTTKTRTELIEMGMDADWVGDLPTKNEDVDNDQERRARSSLYDETDELGSSNDSSMDDIAYSEAYLMVDYDGDGKAELRKVITVADTMIPDGDDWNEVIDTVPITSMVSKRVPHRHIGESLDDELADLQRIKTVLMRGVMDNSYFLNNSEMAINNLCDVPDFMQSLPGGLKRIDTDLPITGMVIPLPKTPIIEQALLAINYIDSVKDERTGINELTSNVDADILKNANNAVYQEGVNRAEQKVQMIISMIAETGVKELVLRVHELLIKHQDQPRMIRLGGKFVEVNPSRWSDRTDLTINVGIGNGSQEQMRQKLGIANGLQQALAPLGLVTPEKAFNLFDDSLEAMNMKDAGRYALDPKTPEYAQFMKQQQQAAQQPQPNPLAEAEMVKANAKIQMDQMDAQVKMALQKQSEGHQMQMALLKDEAEAAQKAADRASKEAIEAAKLEVQSILESKKIDVGKPGIGAGLQERTYDPATGTLV